MVNIKKVKQSDIGVYVALHNGTPITDGEGHILCIDSTEYDLKRISMLMETAKKFGYKDNLSVEFIDSVRKVSDEEYAIQQARYEAGLDPDPYDIGDIMSAKQNMGVR